MQENRLIYKESHTQSYQKVVAQARAQEIADPEGFEKLLETANPGACGIAAIQSATGATREVVDLLIEALCSNDIRGGCITDSQGHRVGDGGGIALRTNNDSRGKGMQEYLAKKAHEAGHEMHIEEPDTLHGSLFFLDSEVAEKVPQVKRKVSAILRKYGLDPLAFEPAVTNPEAISAHGRATMPLIYQLTYARGNCPREELQKRLFLARIELEKIPGTNVVSLQPGTMTFKAMSRGSELAQFYPELTQERELIVTDAGMVHTRFGTNVLAKWILAQPFDEIAHNGEVNSIRKILKVLENLERMNAIPGSSIMQNASDSANLDRAMQFLTNSKGYSLEEAVRFMIHPPLDELVKMKDADPDLFKYFFAISRIMGSLKAVGPMALLGMDANKLFAALDDMGLRPLRTIKRKDGLYVIASEAGMPHIDHEDIEEWGRIAAGELHTWDRDANHSDSTETNHRITQNTRLNYRDLAAKKKGKLRYSLATRWHPKEHVAKVKEGMERKNPPELYQKRAHAFGLNRVKAGEIQNLVEQGKDPIAGMGSDLAMAAFSPEPNSLGRYLITDYSQVSNPSIDYLREGPFNTAIFLGARPKEQSNGTYNPDTQYRLDDPFLNYDQMCALYSKGKRTNPTRTTISTCFNEPTTASCEQRIEEIKEEVLEKTRNGKHAIIVLSDREHPLRGAGYIPPAVLVAYVSRKLDHLGLSSKVSLVVDTGECLDPHEFNMLISCGAKAVYPRLINEMIENGSTNSSLNKEEQRKNLRKAFVGTLQRYMGKLGITDIDCYRGSQQFSTLGLSTEFVRKYFREEVETNGGGVGFERIIEDQLKRAAMDNRKLRKCDERHGFGKAIWSALQQIGGGIIQTPADVEALRERQKMSEAEFATAMPQVLAHERHLWDTYTTNVNQEGVISIRDAYKLKKAPTPIPLEEVMPRDEIIKKGIRGAAASLGAINNEAHAAVHLLFNRYGSYANSGEGAVPKDRLPGGAMEDAHCGAIQVASGRFGADINYLANPQVQEIEIKIGQGAKPGVGGHLPGHKTFHLVAEIRGVGLGQELISPPTNHDIYSIEDLDALLQRLGACNPTARLGVKITSGKNVGVIAAGCAKAGAGKIQVSGSAGGTGAATSTDRHNTGSPAEFGTAFGYNQLVEQGLKSNAIFGADGGIRTGEDILKLMILGADEVSIMSLLMVSQLKCIFCNQCSTQKCPAYITRTVSKFLGASRDHKTIKAEYGLNDDQWEQLQRLLYNGIRTLEFLAEDMRRHMAAMGVRTIEELKGKRELLIQDPEIAAQYPWLKDFDHDIFLKSPKPIFTPPKSTEAQTHEQYQPDQIEFYLNHPRVNEANRAVIRQVARGLERRDNPIHVQIENLRPADRNLGATLSCLMVRGLITPPSEGIVITTIGDAGQGYGTGCTQNVRFRHIGPIQNEGAAFTNGGNITVLSPIPASNKQALVGNTLGYGARGGERYLQSSVGDRFNIRKSSGVDVILGDTGKFLGEYMSGGVTVVFGTLGEAVGAGMSGGTIYTRDPQAASKLKNGSSITKVMRQRDLAEIHKHLTKAYQETRDPELKDFLKNWETRKHEFKKIVALSQYSTSVFQYLYANFANEPFSKAQHETLLADIFEMCGYDIDDPACKVAKEQIQKLLDQGIKHVNHQLNPQPEDSPKIANFKTHEGEEQKFIRTKHMSDQVTKAIEEFAEQLTANLQTFAASLSQ